MKATSYPPCGFRLLSFNTLNTANRGKYDMFVLELDNVFIGYSCFYQSYSVKNRQTLTIAGCGEQVPVSAHCDL